MMRVLENLEPKAVFGFFEDISALPRGSRDTKKISDYLVDFAKERGLRYVQDQFNNVVIYKEAAKGYQAADTIILQGHIDMVCEKTPESKHDFLKDGIELCVDGDMVHAKDTTLGGDNGIAVAMMMAVLDDDDLPHPSLECVFTVDEEIGMLGAEAMDVSCLSGKKFLNIDSEEEGVFTVSCSGGVTAISHIAIKRSAQEGLMAKLRIDGMLGGHSGMEIDKGRGSANQLMARLLYQAAKEFKFRLISISGGQKDNAISKLNETSILIKEEDKEKLEKLVEKMDGVFKHELRVSDKDVTLSVGFEKASANPADQESTDRMIHYMINAPQGIMNMSMDIEDLVETSLNLGALNLEEKADEMTAMYAIRSSVASKVDWLVDRVDSLTKTAGGSLELMGAYPGWEYMEDSVLRDVCVEEYKKLYGKEPKIEAIHAGLECGLFSGKMGGDLDCVSLGPNLYDVHTVDEKMSISSVARTWDLVKAVLAASK